MGRARRQCDVPVRPGSAISFAAEAPLLDSRLGELHSEVSRRRRKAEHKSDTLILPALYACAAAVQAHDGSHNR